VLLATDLPTFGSLVELEASCGLPILTSNQTLLWSALQFLNRRLNRPLGRLFAG
jgi:maleate cis-trans isomerase